MPRGGHVLSLVPLLFSRLAVHKSVLVGRPACSSLLVQRIGRRRSRPRGTRSPLGEAGGELSSPDGRGATVRGSGQEGPPAFLRLLAGARVSLPSAYSIRRSFSSLRLRGASVPCAPVRPQARKFALRHAAQALSSRALIGHVRQPGPTQKGSGAAREPTGHTRRTISYLAKIRTRNT